MSVPSFTDLGNSAREVFKMGYHYGKSLIKLNAKAAGSNLDVGSNLSLDCDAVKVRKIVYDIENFYRELDAR